MTRRACRSRVIRLPGRICYALAPIFWWPNDISIEDCSKSVNSFDIGVFFPETTSHKVSRNVFVVSGAILRPENKADEICHGMSLSDFFNKTSFADV